jgi:hypothetical protein
MTNLELYIVFSYLVLLIPAIESNSFGRFFVWLLSPIAFPILLGIYLDKNFKN